MGRPIVKLPDGRYLEWSEIVDAPVCYSVDREEAVAEWGEDRIARADRWGTSLLHRTSVEEMIVANRAGDGESNLTIEEICEAYHPKNAPADA